jgi:hypothetical protein
MAIRWSGEFGVASLLPAVSDSFSLLSNADENERKCSIVPLVGHAQATESQQDEDGDDPKCSSSKRSLRLIVAGECGVIIGS